MALVKGPFNFKWGNNNLYNVSDIKLDYTVDSTDTKTLDGNKFTTQTGMSASVTMTLLDNDIASLATILPQFYVPMGGTLSTGETVTQPQGAMDIVAASCSVSTVYNQLDIYACGNNAQVLRIPRAYTQVETIEIKDGLRHVAVRFVGEPQSGHGVIQFLQDNETFVS